MKRFVNAALTLVITFTVYQFYVLAVVPIVEPALPTRQYDAATEAEWQGGRHAVGRYQKMLAHYLPANHWALTGAPQVYEYGPLVLVLEDFQPIEGGRIEISRSVLVAFPTPRDQGATPPRDAIVVEAPNPARIQFDELDAGLDFSGGKIGKPVAGVFTGDLLIRSDMRDPGPEDDLRIATRDVRFNQSMITTNAEVDLRLGSHRASGKLLEIRLLQERHPDGNRLPIAGVDSLEIREQVRVTFDINASALSHGKSKGRDRRVVSRVRGVDGQVRLVSAQEPLPSEGPLELTSSGPFRFDFTRFVASIQDNVRAELPRKGLPSDTLLCRELMLHFASKDGGSTKINPAEEPEIARRQGRILSALEPRRVEAIGSPIRIDSPARSASVRGTRLCAWLNERRLRIEGSPASLAQGLSEAQAPLLDYAMPPADSNRVLGDMQATGPGWLRITPKREQPDLVYQARWQATANGDPALVLRRDDRGDPRLSIIGQPEVAAMGLGRLRAKRFDARLVEVAADGKDGPAIELSGSEGNQRGVLVRRIDAQGGAEFVGEQIDGSAQNLVVMLRPLDARQASAGQGPALSSAGGQVARTKAPPSKRYRLATRSIQLDVGLFGTRVDPLSLVCDGGVHITEQLSDMSQEPLQIKGQQLRVDRLNRRGEALLTLSGTDAGSHPTEVNAGLAQVRAKGLHVWVRDLHVDQSAGRAWTDGRGDARLSLPTNDPTNPFSGDATLRWRGGMNFDGSRISVSKEVFAETAGGWLRCGNLTAALSRPIDLRGSGRIEGEVDVEQVDCNGQVTIDYRTTDAEGPRSQERATAQSLSVNRRTGAIQGQGRGSIRSVRLSDGKDTLSGGAKAGLRYLRVDFREGLRGNYQDRTVRFLGGVEAVYGPVLAWDHQLPLHNPEGVPPDAAELRCEELSVYESPASSVQRGSREGAPFGPVELKALGNVRIDASVGNEGGAIAAEATRASYSQQADRFVLEGDGRQLARLWARSDANQPFAPATAQRLTHYLSLGRTTIDDLRGLEYQPPPSAQRQALPRR